MSYEIIKSITFDERSKSVRVCASSNNVRPRTYEPWIPTDHGADYEKFKESFARYLFGGEAQFQPSCKSKAKRAYDNVNDAFGLKRTYDGVWWQVEKMFPYQFDYREFKPKTKKDEELKQKYDEFRERWVSAYLYELNRLIGAPAKKQQALFV